MSKTDKHETGLNDIELEQFFAAGRSEMAEPDAALMARVLADANAEIDAREPRASGRSRRRIRFFAAVGSALGGWPVMASMATAAAAGVWIGAAAPDQVSNVTGGLIGGTAVSSQYDLDELLPGYGLMAAIEEANQ